MYNIIKWTACANIGMRLAFPARGCTPFASAALPSWTLSWPWSALTSLLIMRARRLHGPPPDCSCSASCCIACSACAQPLTGCCSRRKNGCGFQMRFEVWGLRFEFWYLRFAVGGFLFIIFFHFRTDFLSNICSLFSFLCFGIHLYNHLCFFVQRQTPLALGTETYVAPSFPTLFRPQQSFAGYGGPERDLYFLVVCRAHRVFPYIIFRLNSPFK